MAAGTRMVLFLQWQHGRLDLRVFRQSSSVDRLESRRIGLELTGEFVATRTCWLQLGHHGPWQHIPVLCEGLLAGYRLSKTMLRTSVKSKEGVSRQVDRDWLRIAHPSNIPLQYPPEIPADLLRFSSISSRRPYNVPASRNILV